MMFKNSLIKLFDKILFIIYPSKMKKLSIPTSLDNAIETLYNDLKPADIEFIKTKDHASIHHFGGMQMRNNWHLWDTKGDINKDIQSRFGLVHGDDCSGLIFTGVWAKVREQDVSKELKKAAASYKRHWKKCGVDPMTGDYIKGYKPKKISTIMIQVTKDGKIKQL